MRNVSCAIVAMCPFLPGRPREAANAHVWLVTVRCFVADVGSVCERTRTQRCQHRE
ncbi:MAG: hypothetical protein ACM3UV_05545 [Nocardioidaceae bacterium]